MFFTYRDVGHLSRILSAFGSSVGSAGRDPGQTDLRTYGTCQLEKTENSASRKTCQMFGIRMGTEATWLLWVRNWSCGSAARIRTTIYG